MDNNELCEHTRIRLIAAAIGHQQCTKTAANVIPLPGTDRFIAIGTAAEVARLLEIAPAAREVTQQAAKADPLVIALGRGLIEIGQGHHGEARAPAILFGRNGAGAVGVETEGDRFMEPGECIAAITFGTAASLDVVTEKLAELRARIWPDDLAPTTSTVSAPGVSFDAAGHECMSEDECIAAGVNFAGYERGVADAIDACEKLTNLRASTSAVSAPEEVRDQALEEAIAVCKRNRDWKSVDGIRILQRTTADKGSAV